MSDAVVVGAGPNGLSCAIRLAQAGLKVTLVEAQDVIGGGLKTQSLTLPGFIHDVCSACYPMAVASPFLRSLPLEEFGLKWINSEACVAHPFDNGEAVFLFQSLDKTAKSLGVDGEAYFDLFAHFVNHSDQLLKDVLGPTFKIPSHPLLMARFGLKAVMSAQSLAQRTFKTPQAKALFMGVAAHSAAPLDDTASAAVGLVLSLIGHARGWPLPEGGASKIAEALGQYFKKLGGLIVTGQKISHVDELPKAKMVFFDLTPKQIFNLAKDDIKRSLRDRFQAFRYGPGVFKMDWALSSPIPWTNPQVAKSMTVHLGGTVEQIVESEYFPSRGEVAGKPYVLLCQPSLFDSTRAPQGQHTAWAYCHVPNNSTKDMTEIIENQIERFAPGFKSIILKRSSLGPRVLEGLNANLVGGDISGGRIEGLQFLLRPVFKLNPYSLDDQGKLWICSSSTPPGPGVHGMSGFNAAQSALKRLGLA